MLDSINVAVYSKLEILFNLVVRLHCLIMCYKCHVHFIHVAVTGTVSQGTDGLSRGEMYEGIMKDETMLSFLPL